MLEPRPKSVVAAVAAQRASRSHICMFSRHAMLRGVYLGLGAKTPVADWTIRAEFARLALLQSSQPSRHEPIDQHYAPQRTLAAASLARTGRWPPCSFKQRGNRRFSAALAPRSVRPGRQGRKKPPIAPLLETARGPSTRARKA